MQNGAESVLGFRCDGSHRQWCAPSPKAVFLLVHGLGTHSGRWEAMAEFFLDNGISSYAVELRAPCSADGVNAGEEGFSAYYKKILSLYTIAKKEDPGKKIFLVGESMGALLSFLLCHGQPGSFAGLIAISPAFLARHDFPLSECIDMLAHLFYDRKKRFTLPFDSSMCTRDIDAKNKLDRDPLEYRSVPASIIFGILLAQVRARMIKKISTPVLFLLAGEDRIVDPKAARDIYNGLTCKDKTLLEFPEMYHSLSVELGKEKVFKEILDWVGKRI